jgi:signal transduction histidine kinase
MTSAPRVVLVDDDPIMLELAQAKLGEAGYCVLTAQNGVEAAALLKEKGADLVISDLEMPVMTGYELTEIIRADARLSDTPVIVITASNQADAVDRAFAAGATSFLAKPINWTLFTQATMFVLRASEDQKSLRIARDQAEAGARFKDGLLSVMSHELRTPLNAIIGFGQLLGEQFEKDKNDAHQEYAEFIVDSGKRLLDTISDMLLASDASSGPLALNETDQTVEELFEEAKSIAAPVIAPALPNLLVRIQDKNQEIQCDRQLLARAIAKLLENAVKFSPQDAKICFGAMRTQNGGLAIFVKDDGPGIEPEKLKDVATPFNQSDMSLKRSKEGLGLGLSLAKAITSAHGAGFRLESEPGAGTKAVIILPPRRVLGAAKSAAAENAA